LRSRRDPLSNRAHKIGIVHRFFRPSADIIDSVSRAFQIFLDVFLRAKSGMVSAQRNARLGGTISRKTITAILAESGREFQFLGGDGLIAYWCNTVTASFVFPSCLATVR
jgi:hypothetical protein